MIASRLGALALAVGIIATPAQARDPVRQVWIPTWYAAPEPTGNVQARLSNQTLRQIIRVSAGGTSVRLRLSNAYGAEPLRIDSVGLARRAGGSRIDPASNMHVTFGGRTSVTIAPGAYILSDAMHLNVSEDSDLALSLYVTNPTPMATIHDIQRSALYVASGDATTAVEFPENPVDIGIGSAFPWIAEVEVSGSQAVATLIAFGDSITDGYGIDRDKGGTWPEVLGRRLHEANIPLSVVNAGISGNRLLHHGQWAPFGDNSLARFDRDVLAQPNAAAVIVLIGINDLGHAQGPGSSQYVSAEDIANGLSQMAARAHARGLRIYAGTLTPFKGTVFEGYYTDEKEARRQAINSWIRQSDIFDGVFDFDKVLEAPGISGQIRPEFDVGDHLHPGTAGAAAMGNAIPLEAFKWAKKLRRR